MNEIMPANNTNDHLTICKVKVLRSCTYCKEIEITSLSVCPAWSGSVQKKKLVTLS